MDKKAPILLIGLGLVVVIGAAVVLERRDQGPRDDVARTADAAVLPAAAEPAAAAADAPVKEFVMQSFVEFVDGKPKPQFSLKEIDVKKGDLVRIKITNTKGKHDFKIDEFNVYAMTPVGEEVRVEFLADKVGEFIYYCNQPGHRQAGHWGTLKVTE